MLVRDYCAQERTVARLLGVFCLLLPPRTADEANADCPGEADVQAELLDKEAVMCDAITQGIGVRAAREPELRQQLTAARAAHPRSRSLISWVS